jgi:hypothetical protein
MVTVVKMSKDGKAAERVGESENPPGYFFTKRSSRIRL